MMNTPNNAKYTSGRCALIVVDMQNDFCAEGGFVARRLGRDMSIFKDIAKGVERLLAAARAGGIPVVWIAARYEDQLISPAMREQLRQRSDDETCCVRGTWGFDWFVIKPKAEEATFEKHCFSCFSNPDFADHINRLGVDTLVFAGVQSNVCVESSLRDAHSHGFHVALAEQAVGSHTPALHEATLANVRLFFGEVLDIADLERIWETTKSEVVG